MNTSRYFWIAGFLSCCFHAVVFGCFWLFVSRLSGDSSPWLLVAYGDSGREGMPCDVVAVEPGTLRQGDQHTPGGDDGPKDPAAKLTSAAVAPMLKSDRPEEPPAVETPASKAAEDPPAPKPVARPPAAAPPAEKPAEPMPKPELPQEQPAAEKPVSEPAPQPPRPVAGESRVQESKPSKPAPGDSRTAALIPAPAGGPPLAGARGGARLPPGTPSAGGSVGSRNGVRTADGTRPPRYPPEAREAGIEGTPVIWLRVSPAGEVLEARLHKSCGYQILDDAALRWARAQKYVPARHGNTPVEAEVTEPVRFYLY